MEEEGHSVQGMVAKILMVTSDQSSSWWTFSLPWTEWCSGWSLPCQSVQLAHRGDHHDELPVHPRRPLAGHDRHHQGEPITQVRCRHHLLLYLLFTGPFLLCLTQLDSTGFLSFSIWWKLVWLDWTRRLTLCCVSPEQRLFVSADPGSPRCHPVCNRPLALPHLPLEVHPQSSALLPWLDLRVSRENDHINKSLAGECVTLFFFYEWLPTLSPLLLPHTLGSTALFDCSPCRWSPESCEDVFWSQTSALQLPGLPAAASCA